MDDHDRLLLLARQVRELAAVTLPESGTCDWGDCIGLAAGYRWSDEHGWLPVCRDHQEPVQPVQYLPRLRWIAGLPCLPD